MPKASCCYSAVTNSRSPWNFQDANNGDKQRVEVGADLDLEETNCASIEALFWDVDGKARDGVLYYRMTENGVEDYE